MEVHSSAPAAARRMWVYLRAVFMMARKGLLSNKRKLLLGVHLLMKRRNKAVSRTVANLLSHHGGGHNGNALRRRDYEFSCSGDSPATAFTASSRRYFPSCLGADGAAEELAASPSPAPPLARIEYCYYATSPVPSSSPGLLLHEEELDEEYCAAGASSSPALGGGDGGFSVRVSNYSSEDNEGGGGGEAVDDEAEEFIRRFYEQLRRQNTVAMLPYYLAQESAAA